jgi:hypothetical protein
VVWAWAHQGTTKANDTIANGNAFMTTDRKDGNETKINPTGRLAVKIHLIKRWAGLG